MHPVKITFRIKPVSIFAKRNESSGFVRCDEVCVGVYEMSPSLFQVPISIVKTRMTKNVGRKNGETAYWLHADGYTEFKTEKLLIP
ncbi:MAG: hypothetical protein M0Z77_11885 [Thermoplasmatales archaeon]|nr:hypothetical protein [Thermoplasmatales archaeon]